MKNPTDQSPDQPIETRTRTGHTPWVIWHSSNYSLRTKLIVAFLVMTLVPLGMLAFLNNRSTRTALIDAANQALLAGACQTAAKIDAFIVANLEAVSTEALLPGMVEYLRLPPDQRAGSDEERLVQETLRGLKGKDEHILSYALLNTEGQNVMDTVTADIGQDESNRDYFYEPTLTNQPYVSPNEFDPTTGEAALYFSSPVHSGQEVIGVLRVRYGATVLQQLIVQSNGLTGEQSFAILLDENHVRLAHGTAPDLIFKLVVPHDPARIKQLQAIGRLPVRPAAELATDIPALEAGLASVDTAEPYFTTKLVATGERLDSAAVTRTETQPWLVVFARPQEAFLAPVEGQTRITLLLLAVVIAGVVVAVAIGMAQWLASPITRLTAIAAKIAAGDLTAQAQVESGDEISTLAATFNSMTTQLRQTMEGLEQRVADLKRAEEEIRQRTAQLEALRQVGLEFTAQLDLNDLLHSIVSRAIALLGGTAGGIYLYWPERDGLEGSVAIGANLASIGTVLQQGEGLAGKVWETGEPLIVNDYEHWEGRAVDLDGYPVAGVVGVPVRWGEEFLGVLNTQAAPPRTFSSADAEMLGLFATQAAIAIRNARLFEKEQQRVAELEALQRTSLQLTSSLNLSAVLDSIVTSALTLVGANDCHIYLYDEATETFTFGTALWKSGRREPAVQALRRDGLTATVARGGRPIVINDAPHHPLYATPEAQKWSMQAIAGFPLKRAGRVLGVFTIAFLEPHTFSQEELRVLGLLADQAIIAIENAQLYRQLRDHAEQLEQRVQERTAQLQAQYAHLEAILRSASDGIVVADAGGEILQTNPVAQAWLTQTLSPEDAARLRATAQDLARRAEERPETVLELSGLDLELKAAPILQPGMEGAIAAVVDIHDVSHLKALNRVKSRFVSNVSHELRTPVTTIKLYAALMQRQPQKWEEYLAPLAQEADRQARLVADILQISRIDTGRLEMKPWPTSLNQLTEKIVASHEMLAQERGLTLEHHPAEPEPVALADPKRMTQVLNNLVENAIRYTPEGGQVVVSTGQEEAEGRVWATVTVADTGMGIPEQELPHIFERFFRGEKVRLMQISGTGLGLAIVKEIVELHGGRVTVESQVDVGAAFTIWLPLTDAQG